MEDRQTFLRHLGQKWQNMLLRRTIALCRIHGPMSGVLCHHAAIRDCLACCCACAMSFLTQRTGKGFDAQHINWPGSFAADNVSVIDNWNHKSRSVPAKLQQPEPSAGRMLQLQLPSVALTRPKKACVHLTLIMAHCQYVVTFTAGNLLRDVLVLLRAALPRHATSDSAPTANRSTRSAAWLHLSQSLAPPSKRKPRSAQSLNT